MQIFGRNFLVTTRVVLTAWRWPERKIMLLSRASSRQVFKHGFLLSILIIIHKNEKWSGWT
tara:strand:- start:224 stop:406 length:183 start_codon:yes stop_codon:yes gene_type:complete